MTSDDHYFPLVQGLVSNQACCRMEIKLTTASIHARCTSGRFDHWDKQLVNLGYIFQ
jgi:hypothetical protein